MDKGVSRDIEEFCEMLLTKNCGSLFVRARFLAEEFLSDVKAKEFAKLCKKH